MFASSPRWLVPAVLFLVALAVRLPNINSDLWLDEIVTLVDFIRLPIHEIASTYTSPNNHVGYSILAHMSVGAFGESAWAVRLPALLFGAATAPLLYGLARNFLSQRESLAAGLLIAVSYHHVYFSQSARAYTGMICLALASTLAISRALKEGRAAHWKVWAVTTSVTVYLLLSGLFIAIGQVIGALLASFRPPTGTTSPQALRRLLIWTGVAAALTLILYAPLLRELVYFYTHTSGESVGWKLTPALLLVLVRDALPHPLMLAGAVVALPVFLVGLVSLVRRNFMIFFCLALPVLIELSVTLAIGAGTYPRRFLLLLPFLLLVAVHGSALIAEKAGQVLGRASVSNAVFVPAIVIGALICAAGLPRLYALPKQDYTGAVAYIEQHRDPGDIVVAVDLAVTGVRYYDPGAILVRDLESLQSLVTANREIWLIGTFLQQMQRRKPEISSFIEEHFERVIELPGQVGDGAVVVWSLGQGFPSP
jgi:uncharacterized membrane protein